MKHVLVLGVAMLCGMTRIAAAASDTYLPSNQPLIKGTVVSTTDHSITVDSFTGEQMTFTIDSRTVVPTNLAAGTRVKIEFHAMEDGRYHAARVTPFEPTPDEVAAIQPVTVDTGQEIPAREVEYREADVTTTSNVEATSGADQISSTDERRYASAEETPAEEQSELPATAGNRNALWMIGLGALGAAGAMWFARHRRTA